MRQHAQGLTFLEAVAPTAAAVIPCFVVAAAIACSHSPTAKVKVAGVALDTYVDRAAERLSEATDDAIDTCNGRSNSQAEYFECMAPMNATLAKAEMALAKLVAGQEAAFVSLEAVDEFEAAIRGVQ